MIRCDKCGEYNGDTRETCFKCGESLNNPQGVERRVFCGGCGNVYTTAKRYCPQCGGLLQEFHGSTEMARLIREQRELNIVGLKRWEKVLCYLVPGFGISMARREMMFGDPKHANEWHTHGLIATIIHVVVLVILMFVLTIVARTQPRISYDASRPLEVTSEVEGSTVKITVTQEDAP